MAAKARLKTLDVRIPVEDRVLDGVINVPSPSSWDGCAVVLTHGAGGDLHFHHLEQIATHLARTGILCLRFTCKTPNFQYRLRCFEAAVSYLGASEEFDVQKCIVAGRSMGARVAAELATQSCLTNRLIFGVACLSYPLHPPKRTSELRVSSLLHLGIPVLFVSGTHDPMCRMDLMEGKVLTRLGTNWEMRWVENADHTLNINSKSNAEVVDIMCDWVVKWCQSVFMAER
ncbi:predicted protein [Nematostella vectensis]|uniref:KANL3/Tex30 alpha/beta hydrolase-like domain-containing protein n=1 Tax=Nematostella vectensis TaxID=45351 RepID=A7RIU9_NEMVE|nr:testis-expressed protein 30 [Nematostella vectensis]EDO48462.1 predicted protein [Nematostella vectensis]|eukprot:XP_001640525.1 predicted protein [Nematostella vectensis]